jgi:hypothetical protein
VNETRPGLHGRRTAFRVAEDRAGALSPRAGGHVMEDLLQGRSDTLRVTIHQVGTLMYGMGRDRAGAGRRRVPIRGYFTAAISFARISRARSTLRLMPSSRAAWIWLRWLNSNATRITVSSMRSNRLP